MIRGKNLTFIFLSIIFCSTPSLALNSEPEKILTFISGIEKKEIKERLKFKSDIEKVKLEIGEIREILDFKTNTKPSQILSMLRRVVSKYEGSDGELPENFDLLEVLLTQEPLPMPYELYKEIIRIVVGLRLIVVSGSREAYEYMIETSTRYNGIFRYEIIRNCKRVGDPILPILILFSKSEDKVISQVVSSCLKIIGRDKISEQVRVKDRRVLSELLRSYALIGDREKLDLILSFADHESKLVRDAVKFAIYRFRHLSYWPLRKKYENYTGEEPPENWNWEKVAEEFFKLIEAEREKEHKDLFEKGVNCYKKKDYKSMLEYFRKLLQLSPDYPRKDEIVDFLLDAFQKLTLKGGQKEPNPLDFLIFAKLIVENPEKEGYINTLIKKQELIKAYSNGLFIPEQWREVIDKLNDGSLKKIYDSTIDSFSQQKLKKYKFLGILLLSLVNLIMVVFLTYEYKSYQNKQRN